jgi:hypothetical protein
LHEQIYNKSIEVILHEQIYKKCIEQPYTNKKSILLASHEQICKKSIELTLHEQIYKKSIEVVLQEHWGKLTRTNFRKVQQYPYSNKFYQLLNIRTKPYTRGILK